MTAQLAETPVASRSATCDVDVIVVGYHSRDLVTACLDSLAGDAGLCSLTRTVVDNGSGDGTVESVAGRSDGAVALDLGRNTGFAVANNVGISRGSGRYVLVLNPDTVVTPGAVRTLVDFADAHPDAGVVAPQLLNSDGSPQLTARAFPTVAAGLFGRRSVLSRWLPHNRWTRAYLLERERAADDDQPYTVDWVSGAAMLVPRRVIEQVGGLDEEFFLFWEDADWCRRISDAGYRIWCVPAATIVHHEGGTRRQRTSDHGRRCPGHHVHLRPSGQRHLRHPYLTIFTDETNWIRSKTMVGVGPHETRGRWYPTLTRTPDGRILIIGGIELIDLHEPSATELAANLTIESFDPAAGEQRLMSGPERTPVAIHAGDYAHSFVLPFPSAPKDILILGVRGVPVLGRSTTTDSYVELPRPRPGPSDPKANFGASSVQLPLRVQNGQWGYGNGSAMVVNGNMHTQYEHQADVFDPMTAGWRTPSMEMGFARHHPSTVLLPDGRVLVVDGHDMNGGLDVQKAQYIDPRNGFTVTTDTASSGVIRGYHSVAVLLPDGRVLVAGGRDQVTASSLEKPSYQIYTPSHPAGAPPRLVDAPTSLAYGGLFQLSATGALPKELVLVGLGSMTHSIDMGQRHIQLPIGKTYTTAAGAHLVIAGTPANSYVAPPGYYWMFAVSEAGVPSAAKLVKIG